jgi:putative ABC transport system permease protein
LGYFATDWLMHSIWEYYKNLGVASLTFSVLSMVLIAVLAVGYKTISTASLNPTKTLRDE